MFKIVCELYIKLYLRFRCMVRLISFNMEYCEGTTESALEYLNGVRALHSPKHLDEQMMSYLADWHPDILGLVEVDFGSFRTHQRDEAEFFASHIGFESIIRGSKYQDSLLSRLIRRLPLGGKQGNAVLSSLPVKDTYFHILSRGMKNLVIEVEFENPSFTLLLVHLALFKRTRRYQIKELTQIIQNIDTPVILCGDMNTFHKEEIHHILTKTKLHDLYTESKYSSNPKTEPSWRPKYRLDNVFGSKEVSVEQYRVLNVHFSDHLPVLVDFSVS